MRDVVALGLGMLVLVAHGNVLSVVIAVILERRHAADAIEVALKVHGHEGVFLSVVVAPDAPERRLPAIVVHAC